MGERHLIVIVAAVLCGITVSVTTDEGQDDTVVKAITQPPPKVTEPVPPKHKLCTKSACDCQYQDCRQEVCEWDEGLDGCLCYLKACTYRNGPKPQVQASTSTSFRATLSAVLITAVTTWLFSY